MDTENFLVNFEAALVQKPRPRMAVMSFPVNPTGQTVDRLLWKRSFCWPNSIRLVFHDFCLRRSAFDGYVSSLHAFKCLVQKRWWSKARHFQKLTIWQAEDRIFSRECRGDCTVQRVKTYVIWEFTNLFKKQRWQL